MAIKDDIAELVKQVPKPAGMEIAAGRLNGIRDDIAGWEQELERATRVIAVPLAHTQEQVRLAHAQRQKIPALLTSAKAMVRNFSNEVQQYRPAYGVALGEALADRRRQAAETVRKAVADIHDAAAELDAIHVALQLTGRPTPTLVTPLLLADAAVSADRIIADANIAGQVADHTEAA